MRKTSRFDQENNAISWIIQNPQEAIRIARRIIASRERMRKSLQAGNDAGKEDRKGKGHEQEA